MNNLIAFDIDGVILNLKYNMTNYFRKKYNYTIDQNVYEFDIPELSREQISKDIEHIINTETTPIYKGAKEFLFKYYLSIGNDDAVHFITNRHRETKKSTCSDFENRFGTHLKYKIIFTKDKRKYLLKYGFKYMVEDNPENIEKIHNVLDKVFVPIRPYNIGLKIKNIIYIDTLKDIEKYIVM